MNARIVLYSIFCIFLWPKVTTRASSDVFPHMAGATLLVGSRSPEFLAVSLPNRTLRLLPEPDQVETRDRTPIYPSISLDGDTVGCWRLKAGFPRQIVVATYQIRNRKWTNYAEGRIAGSIAISPDGTRLAFLTPGDSVGPAMLHVVDLKSGEESAALNVKYSQAIMSWAPDDQRLVYESSPSGPESVGYRPTISILNVETGKSIDVADGQAPAWSPSGDWIAYFDASGSKCMAIHPNGTGEILLLPLSHTGIFVRRQRTFAEMPIWSPDSTHLLLNELATEEYGMDIHLLDFGTLKSRVIFKNQSPILAWGRIR